VFKKNSIPHRLEGEQMTFAHTAREKAGERLESLKILSLRAASHFKKRRQEAFKCLLPPPFFEASV
jgi:hypothetical protein